jgi:deazaflavin-dependent oxidoreductase (nitroreductase family)
MWFNPITSWIIRSPLHNLVSKKMMLVSYTGRKSGQRFSTPVNYIEVMESGQLVLYTTSYRERVWWRNLRGGAVVSVRLRGKDMPARAEVFEQQKQVAGELEVYLRQAPKLGRYIGVSIDAGGTPNADELTRAARKMVVIKTTLAHGTEN